MLKRIYVDNFRCFVNFELEVKNKQLWLGANGSGKSSLFDTVLFVKKFLKGDQECFTQSTRTRWQDRPLQVVEIGTLLDRQEYKYRLEIKFDADTRQPSVSVETLLVSGSPVFELAGGQIQFFPHTGTATSVPLETNKSALHLSQLSNTHVRRFLEWINSVHCFRIDEYPGTMDETVDREESQPDYEMGNLAGWYRHLVQAYPDENLRFLSSMKEVLDGFQALRFSADEGGVKTLRADFTASTKTRINYSLAELSDGQRCLLALYMILHFLVARGKTVFIDEPDNFVSLREIQPWVLAADAAVDDHDGQLILISHHPELLNQWAVNHGLRFFRENNGQVRTERFKPDPDLLPSQLISRGWEDE